MTWVDRLKRSLPPPIKVRLLDLRKRIRRKQWEKRVADGEAQVIDGPRLATDLRAIGLGRGQDVIVHSAMSRLGLVEGGAETVIRAIREVVGPDATILMPTYPLRQSMLDWMRDEASFDVLRTRSEMGKITEVFRAMAGVVRSAHPTHPVAAQGPNAVEYTATHHDSRSPAGAGSPFRRLSEKQGLILCLGTGIGKVTSHHVIEDLVEEFPVRVYLPGLMRKKVIFADGICREIEVRVHDPALAPVRVDNNSACERRILTRMRTLGMVREGLVGQAEAYLFSASDLDAMHRAGVLENETIYEPT